MLSFLTSKLGIGLIAVVVLAGVFTWQRVTIGNLRDDKATLETSLTEMEKQRDRAIEAAEHNAAEAVRIQREADRTIAIVTRERDAALARGQKVRTIIKEVQHEPEGECRALDSPAIARAVDWLRGQRPGAGTDHPNRSGEAGTAGRPAVVQ